MDTASSKIVLLGDMARHTMVERATDPTATNAYPYRGHRRLASHALLPEMIQKTLGLETPEQKRLVVPDYQKLCSRVDQLADSCGELISILDLFPEGSTKGRDKRNKLRVHREYLVGPVDPKSSNESTLPDVLNMIEQQLAIDGADAEPQLLALYDHGGFLRKGLSVLRRTKSK